MQWLEHSRRRKINVAGQINELTNSLNKEMRVKTITDNFISHTGALLSVHCLSWMAGGGEEIAGGRCHADLSNRAYSSDCAMDLTMPSFLPETRKAASGQRFQTNRDRYKKVEQIDSAIISWSPTSTCLAILYLLMNFLFSLFQASFTIFKL